MKRPSAFETYLRTGRQLPQPVETKFNPNHDPKDGRFTFSGQGGQSGTVNAPRPATARRRRSPLPSSKRTNELGSLSAQYETSGRGVGTVSSGKTEGGKLDPGGVSYGSYQLTSQTPSKDKAGHLVIVRDGGNVAKFLQNEGAQWAPQFAGLAPGSDQFSNVWKRVAAADPEALHAAEHKYVKRKNYDPAVQNIHAVTGLNIDALDPSVKDVLRSTAVQHGAGRVGPKSAGATEIFVDAIRKTDSERSRTAPSYAAQLIKNVYTRRTRYWPSDRDRYRREGAMALRRLGNQ